MGILSDEILERLKKELSDLDAAVNIIFFDDPEGNCRHCRESSEFLDEVSANAGGKINVRKIVLTDDPDAAGKYGVFAAPAMILLDADGRDRGIRFFGIPGGHELASFVAAVKMVSSGGAGITAETSKAVAELQKPVDLKVFVTLACPYCPAAVQLAHKFAYASSGKITASMIDAAGFMSLSSKHSVMRVPKIVIADKDSVEGAPSEAALLERVKAAAQ
jgi:glutaredoxin-like protein